MDQSLCSPQSCSRGWGECPRLLTISGRKPLLGRLLPPSAGGCPQKAEIKNKNPTLKEGEESCGAQRKFVLPTDRPSPAWPGARALSGTIWLTEDGEKRTTALSQRQELVFPGSGTQNIGFSRCATPSSCSALMGKEEGKASGEECGVCLECAPSSPHPHSLAPGLIGSGAEQGQATARLGGGRFRLPACLSLLEVQRLPLGTGPRHVAGGHCQARGSGSKEGGSGSPVWAKAKAHFPGWQASLRSPQRPGNSRARASGEPVPAAPTPNVARRSSSRPAGAQGRRPKGVEGQKHRAQP